MSLPRSATRTPSLHRKRRPGDSMNATWLDTLPLLGQASRVAPSQALGSRQGLSFLETRGGRVRLRRAPSPRGPRLLIGTDGPNVIEHYDALLRAFEGLADVVLFEPPGTGGSAPGRGFDFTLEAFSQACGEVLTAVGPRTLVFPCYLGFVAQQLARRTPELVQRLVLPQTPSWTDMGVWSTGVDPRRIVRRPVLGQFLVAINRRRIAQGWYRASVGDPRFQAPFNAAAREAFDWGGCFCLASLMQGFGRSAAPDASPLPVPVAIVWGAKDRTHRRSDPATSLPGAQTLRFEDCGHCPELEAPERFVQWLLAWHEEQP